MTRDQRRPPSRRLEPGAPSGSLGRRLPGQVVTATPRSRYLSPFVFGVKSQGLVRRQRSPQSLLAGSGRRGSAGAASPDDHEGPHTLGHPTHLYR